ncbi:MAG: rhodanese-like domain-containing protein [Victivallaceae bacterium]|nr:rhodanese-like domain-containing protein [Victivallaceae bacterium]
MVVSIMRCVLSGTVLAILLTGCSDGPDGATPGRDSENMVIIDVRTRDEYAAGHLPNARLMPYDRIGEMIGDAVADKNAEIVLYCRSGKRAEAAGAVLSALSYGNVRNLGGVQAAAETLGLPVVE